MVNYLKEGLLEMPLLVFWLVVTLEKQPENEFLREKTRTECFLAKIPEFFLSRDLQAILKFFSALDIDQLFKLYYHYLQG